LTITLAGTTEVSTPTFLAPEDFRTPGYELLASPTLYPGQQVRARVIANAANTGPVTARLMFSHYAADDAERQVRGESVSIAAGTDSVVTLRIPTVDGQPINSIGLQVDGADGDRLLLDTLDWSGEPDVTLDRPAESGQMWRRAWVDAVDHFSARSAHPFDLTQDRGRGLAICGTRDWHDYTVSTTVAPHLADVAGLAVRVQGLRRYYAVLLSKAGTARLVKVVDGSEQELAGIPIEWVLDHPYAISVTVSGAPGDAVQLDATIDGVSLSATDPASPDGVVIDGGGIAFVVEAGHIYGDAVTIKPAC
jgi:hypothetical protein